MVEHLAELRLVLRQRAHIHLAERRWQAREVELLPSEQGDPNVSEPGVLEQGIRRTAGLLLGTQVDAESDPASRQRVAVGGSEAIEVGRADETVEWNRTPTADQSADRTDVGRTFQSDESRVRRDAGRDGLGSDGNLVRRPARVDRDRRADERRGKNCKPKGLARWASHC
jgi:hypothetical protein